MEVKTFMYSHMLRHCCCNFLPTLRDKIESVTLDSANATKVYKSSLCVGELGLGIMSASNTHGVRG